MEQVDLWWRPVGGLVLYGSLLADATNSPRTSNSCCQMGGSLGLEIAGMAPGWTFRAQGTAIQSLVYRTSVPWEEYSIERIGLGWDKVDLYLWTLEADWVGSPGLVLRPRLDLQLKGEGDFRQLRPPSEELPGVPRILIGQTETTFRPSIAGSWRPRRFGGVALDLRWDLGLNFIRDYGHVEGDDRTEFVGSVRLLLETPHWIIPLGG